MEKLKLMEKCYIMLKTNGSILWNGKRIQTEKEFIKVAGVLVGYGKLKRLIAQWKTDEVVQLKIENEKLQNEISELHLKLCRKHNELWELRKSMKPLEELPFGEVLNMIMSSVVKEVK